MYIIGERKVYGECVSLYIYIYSRIDNIIYKPICLCVYMKRKKK